MSLARLPIPSVFGLLWTFHLFCSLSLHAHEGHAPLPSKGVQVDVVKGLITLSPEAQKALGLQTAAVQQKKEAPHGKRKSSRRRTHDVLHGAENGGTVLSVGDAG